MSARLTSCAGGIARAGAAARLAAVLSSQRGNSIFFQINSGVLPTATQAHRGHAANCATRAEGKQARESVSPRDHRCFGSEAAHAASTSSTSQRLCFSEMVALGVWHCSELWRRAAEYHREREDAVSGGECCQASSESIDVDCARAAGASAESRQSAASQREARVRVRRQTRPGIAAESRELPD